MKNHYSTLLMFAGACTLGAGCSLVKKAEPVRPNVIFVLADDLGYSELGCYGNTFNETPNLDKMAAGGVRFTNAYASAPVCSPYRAALMTGLYPARLGITDYLRPDAGQFLDTALMILPEALKANGYHTGIIGKWHLSGYASHNAPIEVLPDKQGFDEVISSETAGIANGTYFHPYHFNPAMEKKLNTGREFLVDRMNQEAVEFIEKNHGSPFFLYLSHYAVHTMMHGQPDVVDHFRAKSGAGKSEPSRDNPENDPYKKWPADYFAPKNNPHLAAQLKIMDDGIGMIMDKLKELGIEKNTIIIFTSDNGGETRVTDNYPLREGKSTLYEGGIREPMIVYQPGKIAGGRVIDTPISNYDIYPTLCDLTGTNSPESHSFDGISIADLLKGDESGENVTRAFFWHYPLAERHFLGGRSSGAIREGDWKLIEFFDTGEIELYNLADDIGEEKNLLNDNPARAKALGENLAAWRRKVVADKQ